MGHKRTTGVAEIFTTSAFRDCDHLQWKLRTLDKPFGFLVLKPSGVRFAEVSFRNYLVTWGYVAGIGIMIRFIWAIYIGIAGAMASRAQWRFGIFAVGLQMAIKLNQVNGFKLALR